MAETESQLVELHLSKKQQKKNLYPGQIKMYILACLCKIGSDGANSLTIQHHSHVKSQDSNQFKEHLQILCDLDLVQSHYEETSGKNKRIRYKILEKGRMLVNMYRTSILPDIFGSIDDVYTE